MVSSKPQGTPMVMLSTAFTKWMTAWITSGYFSVMFSEFLLYTCSFSLAQASARAQHNSLRGPALSGGQLALRP